MTIFSWSKSSDVNVCLATYALGKSQSLYNLLRLAKASKSSSFHAVGSCSCAKSAASYQQ